MNASLKRCANVFTKEWNSSRATKKFVRAASSKSSAHALVVAGAVSKHEARMQLISQQLVTFQRSALLHVMKSSRRANQLSL